MELNPFSLLLIVIFFLLIKLCSNLFKSKAKPGQDEWHLGFPFAPQVIPAEFAAQIKAKSITRASDINPVFNFIYVIACKNGGVYVGETTDLTKRLNDHFTGNGAQFTKKILP